MASDIDGLLELPEAKLRHSLGDSPHAALIVDLVLRLQANNRTPGQRLANKIAADMVRRSGITCTLNHPQLAEIVRDWAGFIDEEIGNV